MAEWLRAGLQILLRAALEAGFPHLSRFVHAMVFRGFRRAVRKILNAETVAAVPEASPINAWRASMADPLLKRIKRAIKRCMRDDGVRDLLTFDYRYRPIYAARFRRGDTGTRIGLLLLAYDRGHLRLSRYSSTVEPSERAKAERARAEYDARANLRGEG